jgi:hypothetical protein
LKEKHKRPPKPAKKLPAVKDAMLGDIHREVAACAAWAEKMGYREIHQRMEWAAQSLLYSDNL